ncbi:branched-chain amino acid ABC transporter permease [Zymobacter palmae]|uniref:ABC transporter permease protein n=1 Tax=Zymobacter palmae TaxID=33074 RepID=A0A348HDZ4_9GAMM|nr:branched-chain amino acid ABC transporter permease [Zymobacter palmae]BBG29846.1 ABC transporter permease protein [Zymobacter palmae]
MNAFKYGIWLIIGLALIGVAAADSNYAYRVGTTILIFALLGASANLLTGTTGLMSLGHAGIYGIGAYTSALLSTSAGLPLWATIPLAGIVAAIFGVLITLPALRLTSVYFAVATLGVGQIIYVALLNWISVTNGPMGISDIPPLFSVSTSVTFWVTLAIVAAGLWFIHRVVHSLYGNVLRALREDDQCVQAVGLSPLVLKSQALMISFFMAGLAGALWAHSTGYIAPESFQFDQSILILAIIVVGGLGSLPGAVLGAVLLTGLPEVLRPLGDYRMFTVGLVMFLTIVLRPSGLWPEVLALRWLQRRPARSEVK